MNMVAIITAYGRHPGQHRDRFNLTGKAMGQLRTTNKRHKRAIAKAQVQKPATVAAASPQKAAKAAR